jgi:hypothetical protein
MKKYKVTLYTEQYTEIEVDALSSEDAEDMVISGNYSEDQILDVSVKESDIIKTEELDGEIKYQ